MFLDSVCRMFSYSLGIGYLVLFCLCVQFFFFLIVVCAGSLFIGSCCFGYLVFRMFCVRIFCSGILEFGYYVFGYLLFRVIGILGLFC